MPTETTRVDSPIETVNEVKLVGRVTRDAVVTELPSGDELVTFRISVGRNDRDRDQKRKVDSVPCCAWSSKVRRSTRTWRAGDVVEVAGAVRSRFFQTARGLGSRVEVEVQSARIVSRAPAA